MMQATIKTVLDDTSFVFTGNHAVAAIAAVRAHKMIDSMGAPLGASSDNPETRLQIPYSSVVMAQFQFAPDDTEVEDANCKVRTPAVETGTLTIRNTGNQAASNTTVLLMSSTPATYSGIEFSVVHEGGFTFIHGTIPSIAVGDSFVLEGIPVGTRYNIPNATPATKMGVIPGEANIQSVL